MTGAARAPSKWRWAAEYPRAAWGVLHYLATRAQLRREPRDGGMPVMVLPGLFNSDRSRFALIGYLAARGHRVRGWGLGRNLGSRTVGADAERLIAQAAAFAAEAGEPVALGSVLNHRRVVTEPILVSGKEQGGSDAEAS